MTGWASAAAIGLFIFSNGSAAASAPRSCEISGTVVAQNEEPISSVLVVAYRKDEKLGESYSSDMGVYKIDFQIGGEITSVEYEHPDYTRTSVKGISGTRSHKISKVLCRKADKLAFAAALDTLDTYEMIYFRYKDKFTTERLTELSTELETLRVDKRAQQRLVAMKKLYVREASVAVRSHQLPTIGCTIYKFDDAFMTGVRNAILGSAKAKAEVDMVDSQNSQATQNDKVDLFITKKVKALVITPVDRAAAGVIISKAKAAKIPVVFFNREPFKDDLAKYDKAYYVGAVTEQSGTMEGKLLVDYWKAHPEADLNKDGVMQYVMLKGELGDRDAELRTKFSVRAITDAGIKVEKVAEDTGMWDRVKGREKMAAFLATHKNIEAVIANNDDMALGAIEALKAAGYFKDGKFMPVVGVDATSPALAALKDGTLLGTVLNDSKNQGKATFNLSYALASGMTPTKVNVGYDITDGKYVWVPYKPITKDNMEFWNVDGW